jgi:hypothetical protein
VVQNRVVSASSVSLGNVLVGYTASGTSNLTTSGGNNNYTAVTVNSILFNSAASTGAYNLSQSFGTSGSASGSTTLPTTGEGLAGESPINVSVGYTANVFQAASLTTSSFLGSGTQNLNLTNAASTDGGQRAGVTVTALTFSNQNFGTTLNSGTGAQVGIATGSNVTQTIGTVSIRSDRLNGSYSTGGTVTGTIGYTDSTLAAQAGIANKTWTISTTTTTITTATSASQSQLRYADVVSGGTYTNYGLTSAVSGGFSPATAAKILSSVTTTTATTLGMAFDTAANFGIGTTGTVASDVLSLSGAQSGKAYVLQLSYDPAVVTTYATGSVPYIGYWTGSAWVNAADGSNNGRSAINGAWSNVIGLATGAYGYDSSSNIAWAVVSSYPSGDFAVIPEPSACAMALGGFGLLIAIQRMRRRRE